VVITRGTDAHGHLPAAVAGNIYRALSPRFGTLINFQVASADEGDETPTGNGNKKAEALNEENKETKAAIEAEENAASSADSTNNANAAGTDPKTKVKPTVMTVDPKAKPAAKTSAAPAKTTATPAKTPAKDPNDGRPRRIQPDRQ